MSNEQLHTDMYRNNGKKKQTQPKRCTTNDLKQHGCVLQNEFQLYYGFC